MGERDLRATRAQGLTSDCGVTPENGGLPMSAMAHHSFFPGQSVATSAVSQDRSAAAPVGRALITAGKFVGNFAVALATVVLLGADADL
jgi:hypothetical protein